MRRAGIKPLILVLLVATPAFGQDRGKSIDLFEDQDEMSSSAISIEGSDGESVAEGSWDGDTPTRVDGGITIKYERNGPSILVPAKVEGKGVYFLFDTGATYTTLNGAFARSVGIAPGKGAPSMVGQTANGPRSMKVGLIKRLALGGRGHYGVTFTVCDACPTGRYRGKPIVGLLGLNVIGRYRTSFDDAQGELEMFPTAAYSDRTRDVRPWLKLNYGRARDDGKVYKFVLDVHNRAPRRIKNLTMEFSCAGGEPAKISRSFKAKGTTRVIPEIPTGNCPSGFQGDVVEAKW